MSGKAAGRSTTRKVGDADAGQKPTTGNPSAKHVGRERCLATPSCQLWPEGAPRESDRRLGGLKAPSP
eukprot:1941617-Prymnesium_polylepis.1